MSFRNARRLAGLFALASAALAISLAWRGSNRPNAFLNQSFATLAALVVSAAATAVAARLAMLSDAAEPRFHDFAQAWRRLSPPQGHRAVSFVVALIALGLHAEIVLQQRPYKNVEYRDDEADYLRVADEIQALPGGVASLLPALYRGEFAEDNRHPLYPALLAGGRQARLGDRPLLLAPTELSRAFGLFVTLATAVIGWKMFTPAVGALASLLVALNGAMVQSSSLIACETLLALLTTLGWFAYASSPRPLSPLRAVLVGLLFGLAYLTKASAAFPFFFLLLAAVQKSDAPASRKSGVVATIALAFVLVASPLLVRNVVRYHNPLHSFNNKLLFADSYDAGIREPDRGTFGNLQRYLARHTVKEVVVDRFLGGILWEGFVLLRSLGPWPFDSGRTLFGSVLLAGAVIAMTAERGTRLAPGFLLAWTGWFLVFFGWYQPIASGDRFLLPLVSPLLIAGSVGLLSVSRAVLLRAKNSA